MLKTNPSFYVKPVNTVKNINRHFLHYDNWITPENCKLKSLPRKVMKVELIKCLPDTAKNITRKMLNGNEYEPIPSNYLLGLAFQYPKSHHEYEYIISFDKENIFKDNYGTPSFLCINWEGNRDIRLIDGVQRIFDKEWWFAVFSKNNPNIS